MSTVYNQTLFEVAHKRMRLAPLELTETDFTQLAAIDPELETRGRAAQRTLALVEKHMPALQTKGANPDRSQRPVTRKQLEKFADQFGDVVIDILKKTVDPLKATIAGLEARVLELEASAAAARDEVSHADR